MARFRSVRTSTVSEHVLTFRYRYVVLSTVSPSWQAGYVFENDYNYLGRMLVGLVRRSIAWDRRIIAES
jgi:hypothetical protein